MEGFITCFGIFLLHDVDQIPLTFFELRDWTLHGFFIGFQSLLCFWVEILDWAKLVKK